jgi:hypothetical protein
MGLGLNMTEARKTERERMAGRPEPCPPYNGERTAGRLEPCPPYNGESGEGSGGQAGAVPALQRDWKTAWAVLWHEQGALFVRPLSDAVAWALQRRLAGKPVQDTVVAVAESMEKARELEREIKRRRKDEGHHGLAAVAAGGRPDGPAAGAAENEAVRPV